MVQIAAPPTLPNKLANLKVGDELIRGALGRHVQRRAGRTPCRCEENSRAASAGKGSEEEPRKVFEDIREECEKLQTLSHPHVVSK